MGCHFLLQGLFPTQGLNPNFLHLLHWQVNSLPQHRLGSPICGLPIPFLNGIFWWTEVLNFEHCLILQFFSLIVIVLYDPSKNLITPKSQFLCLGLSSTLMVFDGSQGYLTVIVVKTFLIGYFGAFCKTKICVSVDLLCSFFSFITLFTESCALNRRRQWHSTPVLLPGKSHGGAW